MGLNGLEPFQPLGKCIHFIIISAKENVEILLVRRITYSLLSYGRVIRKDINTVDGLLPENYNGYNIIEKDDIVLRPY